MRLKLKNKKLWFPIRLPEPLEDRPEKRVKKKVEELKTNIIGLTLSSFVAVMGLGMFKSSADLLNKSKESLYSGMFGGGLFFASLGIEIAGLIGIISFTKGLISLLKKK